MNARRQAGNPSKRGTVGSRGDSATRTALAKLDAAQKETLVQLANALERIGLMEQRWRARDLHEKARVRRELDERLDAASVDAAMQRIRAAAPAPRWRRVLAWLRRSIKG